MSLYRLHSSRSLDSPVLLLGTDSWLDAGFGARATIAHVLDSIQTEVLATFSADDLIDFRARRPTARISDGMVVSMAWPEIQLRAGKDAAGADVLALVGPEPDMAWHAFVRDVVELATDLGVRLVAGVGAYPAPVPHTRPVGLMAIATQPELAAQIGVISGTTEVPAGIQTALQEGFAAANIPAIGVWARVPHYLAATPYPAAAAALVDGLRTVTGLELDARVLREAAEATAVQLGEIIATNDEHREMLRQLEETFDNEAAAPLDLSDLPSGDELAAELERFLRDQ